MRFALYLLLIPIAILFSELATAQTPNFQWVKYGGGGAAVPSNHAMGNGIDHDAAGNLYVAGGFGGNATFGLINISTNVFFDLDAYIAKYDAAGNVAWVVKSGGPDTQIIRDIAVDGVGNSYVIGVFSNSATFGSNVYSSPLRWTAFMAKYDSSGNILWSKKLGRISSGTTYDYLDTTDNFDIEVDNVGNCYLTGIFFDTFSLGTFQLTSQNLSTDMYIAKINSLGSVLWAMRAGGSDTDASNSIDIDASGNCFITGYFRNTANFGGITLSTPTNNAEIFIVKYDEFGNVIWAKQMGGSASGEVGSSINVSNNGDIFITGSFGGTAYFDTIALVTPAFVSQAFIVKLNQIGNVLWAKKGGNGMGDTYGTAISSDDLGNCYVTGRAISNAVFDSVTLAGSATYNFYLIKYGSNGNLEWAKSTTVTGTSQEQFGNAILTDANGNTFVTGHYIDNTTFDTTTLPGSNGIFNMFLLRVGNNPTSISEGLTKSNISVYPNPFAASFHIQLTGYGKGGCALQLHNALGQPVWVKNSVAVSAQGEVKVDVPADLPAGLYSLSVVQGEQVLHQKLVKE